MSTFKLKNIHVLLLVLSILLSSCVENETKEIFQDSATVRKEKAIQELQTLLKSSSDGWKTTYFTDNKILGGYSFLFKFKDGNQVDMASDFNNDYSVASSEYTVNYGAAVKLVFTTKNKIHDLSDSNNSPDGGLTGKGYKGDFEFLYYGMEGDELVFKTNKDFIEVRFKKATAQDWTDFSKNQDIINYIDNSSKHLAYKIGSKLYNFSYNPIRRFSTNIEGDNNLNFGVGYHAKGATLSPAVNVNGTLYSEFTLDKNKAELVSLDGKFTIFLLELPFNINQEWWSNAASTTKSSPTVNAAHASVKTANTNIYGETLSNWARFGNLASGRKGFSLFSFTTATRGYTAQYNVSFQGVFGEPNQLNIAKVSEGFNWRFYRHLNPLLDLYVDNAPYTTELTPATNPTQVKLTSTKNSDIWFILEL